MIVRTLAEILSRNHCLPDRVCRAAGSLIPDEFLPVPAVFADAAGRLAEAGGADIVPVAGLERVAEMNVLGWLQPEFDGQGVNSRLRMTGGVPTRLWEKWEEISGGKLS